MSQRPRLSDISFAEGLARVEAHLENALLLFEAGRVPQALVQASRPMIELMPRLSRDLWSAPEVATELNRAIGAIAAGIRSGAQPPALRAALAKDSRKESPLGHPGPFPSEPGRAMGAARAPLPLGTISGDGG